MGCVGPFGLVWEGDCWKKVLVIRVPKIFPILEDGVELIHASSVHRLSMQLS